jgi:hypothetical protein
MKILIINLIVWSVYFIGMGIGYLWGRYVYKNKEATHGK